MDDRDSGIAAEKGAAARDLSVLLALFAVPWSVLAYANGHVTLLFPWGLVAPPAFHVTTLSEYLIKFTVGLPSFILAWPVGVVCYLVAVASGVGRLLSDREDPRVTGGLLVLAGATQLSLAVGFSAQMGRFAFPLGTLALWFVAWWRYWPRVRAHGRR